MHLDLANAPRRELRRKADATSLSESRYGIRGQRSGAMPAIAQTPACID